MADREIDGQVREKTYSHAPILIVGHAALDHDLCDAIIDLHGRATETPIVPVDGKGKYRPEDPKDEDFMKYTDPMGRNCYSLGPTNPDRKIVLDWIEDVIPWNDDFGVVSYMQIVQYPMDSQMFFHKDQADSNDTGTAIFNLNDNFKGGNHTVDGHTLRPHTGTMIAFNNSTERWHGVDPILQGERWVLAMWFQRPDDENINEGDPDRNDFDPWMVTVGDDYAQSTEHDESDDIEAAKRVEEMIDEGGPVNEKPKVFPKAILKT